MKARIVQTGTQEYRVQYRGSGQTRWRAHRTVFDIESRAEAVEAAILDPTPDKIEAAQAAIDEQGQVWVDRLLAEQPEAEAELDVRTPLSGRAVGGGDDDDLDHPDPRRPRLARSSDRWIISPRFDRGALRPASGAAVPGRGGRHRRGRPFRVHDRSPLDVSRRC